MKLDFRINTILQNTTSFLDDNPILYAYEDTVLPPGKEHYKLLASIGCQLSNCKILEFGTHKGNSTIALNYGNQRHQNSNKITTYDIADMLPDTIFKNCDDICFKIENLFDKQTRELNKEHILSADFIMIDIDPHEGLLEYEMYEWLRDNNYKGVLLFDDIHLKEGHMGVYSGNSMQKFWDKVDNKHKIDITNVGHWSGTGIVCFDMSMHEFVTD
jgi:predicted O-methyltransferase YrrM